MSDIRNWSAEIKDRAGKGAARATRRAGRVPAVVYGGGEPPIMISLDPRDVMRELESHHLFTTRYEIHAGEEKVRVLARDLQMHPVTDRPWHVDFMRVRRWTVINVMVPVVPTNEDAAPGLDLGGVLDVQLFELEVACRADSIPEQIEVDLTGLDIGSTVTLGDITLPEGVKATGEPDQAVLSIAAPRLAIEEEGEEGVEAAEGEEAPAEGEAAEGGEDEEKE